MSDISSEDPRNSAKHKFAVAAVIILSTLIVLALIALVVGGIMTMKGKPAALAAEFSLTEGARILSSETQPGRLILRVANPDGTEEINIVDTDTGKLISRISATKSE